MYIVDDKMMLNYHELLKQGTGGALAAQNYKVIDYPFGRFQVRVVVTESNEFIGIVEIKLNQDFRSYKEKISATGYHDVEKFYPDK